MKMKWIAIVAITLLSVWALVATMGVVLATQSEADLISKNRDLKLAYMDKKNAYTELKTENDELKAENKKTHLKTLAYEMAYDMLWSEIKGEDYDVELEYYIIRAREQLSAEDMATVIEYLGEIMENQKQNS